MKEIVRIWGWDEGLPRGLNVKAKSVDSPDEDSLTMGYQASKNALVRAGIEASRIGAVFFGSESKPYAVKPAATIIAEALGITPSTMASDMEFACRAGSEGLRAAMGLVLGGVIEYGLAIGSDTAQANPGDVLEFTASSGAAAFIVGPADENAVALVEGSYTYVTDTPDFWRRGLKPYPLHGEGFTGEPAYFSHIINAVRGLLEQLGLKPTDFDFAIFHQPNGRFPVKVGTRLGFTKEQIIPGLVTPFIGNTYNGSALLGLTRILDQAKPGQRILVAPFGSGAGSDAYSIVVTDVIEEKQGLAPKVDDYLAWSKDVDYALYTKFRGILEVMK
ncbi:MAG: hydroxymethylglutaryl-CoA synthase [Desulfurococcales archaeon]|nr:hydroxymethylglutaryl-CoA synthase [Desulfurococcales archaeon]